METAKTAFSYDVHVTKAGRIDIPVPFPEGARLRVFVMEQDADSFSDLATAAQSSLGFWDNPLDDADWNHA